MSSGNLLHGNVIGAQLTNDRFGILNSAYLFDGEDDNILIDHDSLLNLSNYDRFSISLWVRPLKFINFGEKNHL